MNWNKTIGIILIVAGLLLFLYEGYWLIHYGLKPIEEYKAQFEDKGNTPKENVHYSANYFTVIKNTFIIVGAVRSFVFLALAGVGFFLYRKDRKEVIVPQAGPDSHL